MPGCTSITEAITGLEAGASMIKAFPISNFYGPDLISVFKTPIPYMPILASGESHWMKSQYGSRRVPIV